MAGKKNADKYQACKDKQHDLEEIFSAHVTGSVYNTVRWCPLCGAVVVDQDFDGRTNAGKIMEMKTPQIAEEQIFSKMS